MEKTMFDEWYERRIDAEGILKCQDYTEEEKIDILQEMGLELNDIVYLMLNMEGK